MTVTTDGSLTGSIGACTLQQTACGDRYIAESVSFSLPAGQTRAFVTATLTVTSLIAPFTSTSTSVKIDVVDGLPLPADPISDTDLENQSVSVNISIENGLRAMYLQQVIVDANRAFFPQTGTTSTAAPAANNACGTTAFSVWAFSNSGHVPTNSTSTDIYAEWVQKGINYILSVSTVTSPVPLQTPSGGSAFNPDGDGNTRMVNLCSGTNEGYQTPVAAAAIMASFSGPNKTNNAPAIGPAGVSGQTYYQIVQDTIDWIAFAQYNGPGGAQGGWLYSANSGSDTSIDSWHYMAMEGFEAAYGGTVLEIVKSEAEKRINSSQNVTAGSVGMFGYTTTSALGNYGNATTAGGLSGSVMTTYGGRTPAYLNSTLSNATFPNVTARQNAALNHLGYRWDAAAGTWAGNLGNYYAMWTSARALRLFGASTLTKFTAAPTSPVNSATGPTFYWEQGNDVGFTTINGPSLNPTREGYFPYLVRNQVTGVPVPGFPGAAGSFPGSWISTANSGNWTRNLSTAWGILILQPTVFGPPPPVANNDAYSTNEDTPLSVTPPGVRANDVDITGNPLTLTIVTSPSNGSVTLNNDGSFLYTPALNFNGTDTFTYRINNTLANSNVATVTITVNAINDPPVANNNSFNVDEDQVGGLVVAAPGVLANDTDVDSATLTAVLVSSTTNGTLTLNSDGSFSYTPNANFNGTDTADSNTATVTITVDAVNDAPVAVNNAYSTNEDTALTVPVNGVLGNDTDIDNVTLTAVLVTSTSNGTLTLNADGSFTYTPNANFNGSDSFTYKANDGGRE